MVKQFGKDNVYIGTSNKTDNIKSPFKFKEKENDYEKRCLEFQHLRLFKSKTHTNPKEIIGKFDKNKTIIDVVGEKDRYRLKGKYFEPYHPDRVEKGYEEKGYVYVAFSAGWWY